VGYCSSEVRTFVVKDPATILESPEAKNHILPSSARDYDLTSMLVMNLDAAGSEGCPVLVLGYSNGSVTVRDIRSGISSVSLVIANVNFSRKGKSGESSKDFGHTHARPVRFLRSVGLTDVGGRQLDTIATAGDDGHVVWWALNPL